MALRDFSNVDYIPLLSVRPAEMRALQELPERDKDDLLPYVFLRPWTTAHYLDSALSRVEEVYGRRPVVMDLDDVIVAGGRRPVHDELDLLRNPSGGYRNWCGFVAARSNFIPTLQIGEPSQILDQLNFFAALGRGVVIRLSEPTFSQLEVIVSVVAERIRPQDTCFILDYEQKSRELLTRMVATISMVRWITSAVPGCAVAVSASSFPDSFTSITDQDIYERQFFDGIASSVGTEHLIYSDRGSARAERQQGGGGTPTPRVDYPKGQAWIFYRQEDVGDRFAAYQAAARRAVAPPHWDANLRVWGSQMIERTALGDRDAIVSPMRSTSARINIHLHQQLRFSDAARLYDTDDEWRD